MLEELQPHQQRVVDEMNELNEKIKKLTAFVFSVNFTKVVKDVNERQRMADQLGFMQNYSAILAARIENFQ